ncbi:LLM class flavin-dependent oxidoreductase [Cellulomonas soli]|uniref:LLM class flavin-dependent oxidoreductase n=1 Tax=Cellulomonas soli TaxID=931535 RepID=UPI003F851367
MDLGVFSLTDIAGDPSGGPPPSVSRRLDDIVGYGVLADRLGLDEFGIGEHPSHQYAVSCQAVALAAVAPATGTDHPNEGTR